MLPEDFAEATLLGRVWRPSPTGAGYPVPVWVTPEGVFDLSGLAPTVAGILASSAPVSLIQSATDLENLGDPLEIMASTFAAEEGGGKPHFLSPVDLQCIKAFGLTFATSIVERVIEEAAEGRPEEADEVRRRYNQRLAGGLSDLKAGSEEALALKEALIADGLWSAVLEVALGPDAALFTKAQVMSAVGTGAKIGIRDDSSWNNPEPEIVLIVSADGRIVGASLGNDMNHRDMEGRSAYLQGQSKDNNGTCAIGPFIRLLDENFTLDDIRSAKVRLQIEGTDGFGLDETSDMSCISRDVTDLVHQAANKHRQFPDGMALFTGTMFAPIIDRGEAGKGFTQHVGDEVMISSPRLGALVNFVDYCHVIEPWTFGIGALLNALPGSQLHSRAKGD